MPEGLERWVLEATQKKVALAKKNLLKLKIGKIVSELFGGLRYVRNLTGNLSIKIALFGQKIKSID